NKEHSARSYRISIDGLEGAALTRPALTGEHDEIVSVNPDTLVNARFFVSLPIDRLKQLDKGEAEFTFILTDIENGTTATKKTSFKGPIKRLYRTPIIPLRGNSARLRGGVFLLLSSCSSASSSP